MPCPARPLIPHLAFIFLVACGGAEPVLEDEPVTMATGGGQATRAGGGSAGAAPVDAGGAAGPTAGGNAGNATPAAGGAAAPTGGGTSSSPCAQGISGARDRVMTVQHGGLTRTFDVHLPASWDGRSPRAVVLNFHGRNSTPSQQRLLTGLVTLADRRGFIAVHPQGVGNTWNAGACCGEAQTRGIDDVGFTGAMLDALAATFCIDARRVYATGLSNGGFMAHRLACELSTRITAVAPVAGTNLTTPCVPSRAVPVLHVHGTADLIVPYQGFVGLAGVADTMSGWAGRNGCARSSAPLFTRGDVSCEQWSGCRDGARVRLCSVSGGGHQWPGGFTIPGLGANTSAFDASDEAWRFFEAHTLP